MTVPQVSNYSEYLRRIDEDGSHSRLKIFRALLKDIPEGIDLLSLMLPSIKKLDIGLDVCDLLLDFRAVAPALYEIVDELRKDPNAFSSYTAYLAIVYPLIFLKNISKISMRIVWDEHFEQKTDFEQEPDPYGTDKGEQELRELLFDLLRKDSYELCSEVDTRDLVGWIVSI